MNISHNKKKEKVTDLNEKIKNYSNWHLKTSLIHSKILSHQLSI